MVLKWCEDPNTEMECVECGAVWKLGYSIVCPVCDGVDGGVLDNKVGGSGV